MNHHLQSFNRVLNLIKSQDNNINNPQQLVNQNLMRPKTSYKTSQNDNRNFLNQSKTNSNTQINSKSTFNINVFIQSRKGFKNINKSQTKLIQQLYRQKCSHLNKPFNQQNYKQFILIFKAINPCFSQKQISINFAQLNVNECEKTINKFIHSQIHTLNLSKNIINPSKINLNNIRKLYLNNCGLSNLQIENLFTNLIQYKNITCLSLNSIQINNRNILTKYQKLYQLIQNCQQLSELYLSNLSIKKDNKIFNYIKNSSIKILDLSKNQGVIGMTQNLIQLNLADNFIENPEPLLNHECKIKNQLTKLNISNNPIPFYQIHKFLKNTYFLKLTSLNLTRLKINEQCPALQQFIGSSYNLKQLSLINCQLNQNSWRNVILGVKSNKLLQMIDLSKNIISNQKIAQQLGTIFTASCRLNKIVLNHCNIKDNYGPLILQNISQCEYIQTISLIQNRLSSITCLSLINVLKHNTKIKTILLQQNCISYSGINDIKKYIQRNNFFILQSIKKDYNQILKFKQLQNIKINQIKKIQKQFAQSKKEKNILQQKIYQIKSKQINQKLTSLKQQIRQYQNIENQMINEIQEAQDHLLQQMENSEMSITKVQEIQNQQLKYKKQQNLNPEINKNNKNQKLNQNKQKIKSEISVQLKSQKKNN